MHATVCIHCVVYGRSFATCCILPLTFYKMACMAKKKKCLSGSPTSELWGRRCESGSVWKWCWLKAGQGSSIRLMGSVVLLWVCLAATNQYSNKDLAPAFEDVSICGITHWTDSLHQQTVVDPYLKVDWLWLVFKRLIKQAELSSADEVAELSSAETFIKTWSALINRPTRTITLLCI